MVPLGRFLILLRLIVVASLTASSAAALAHTLNGSAGLACEISSKGALCQRSGQQHESSAAIPPLIVEELTDLIDDFVSALNGAQPLYNPPLLTTRRGPPFAYLRGACSGRAHPATGPPSLS